MQANSIKDISNFWIAGINYKKTDATIRGQFAVQGELCANILKHAVATGLNELFVLSTCNRTEIYGFSDNASQLIDLLCSQTTGTKELFEELAYVKNGHEASFLCERRARFPDPRGLRNSGPNKIGCKICKRARMHKCPAGAIREHGSSILESDKKPN